MEPNLHDFTDLFDQLGLPSDVSDIKAFIQKNRPLDASMKLWEAPFWTPTQAKFLRDQILLDADWCVVIDKFDTLLRKE